MAPVHELAAHILALPGVKQTTSRFGRKDRPAWCVLGKEFAHLHADDLLDLRLPRKVQAALKGDPRAHFRKSASAWLEFEFHTGEDVRHLAALALEAWASVRAEKNAA
jgi:hypothetical protein